MTRTGIGMVVPQMGAIDCKAASERRLGNKNMEGTDLVGQLE